MATLGALGVVFGDLGTSPLYALHDTFGGEHAIAASRENVLGVLSLFLWALVIVVCIKYLVVMMRADNRGEGGIFALLALTGLTRLDDERGARGPRRLVWVVVVLGIAGAALLYGDGVITPAISVLSAVEGLAVATPVFESYVVPLTVIVLVALFAVQRLGSGRIGIVFGPMLGLWFVVIGVLGVWGIAQHPGVVAAINPVHGVRFFVVHGWNGYRVLGSVVLCLTGAEALYADMGHFGRRPIRVAWFAVAFPGVALSYLGQGAVLLSSAAAAQNPFFRAAPTWSLYPLVAIATAATVIASQALISAVFSLTSQAAQLGLCPPPRTVHTSSSEPGQIYLPMLNWLLMLACLALVLGFRSSTRLAAAYGLAVSGTMMITTLLFILVARNRWKWSVGRIFLVAGAFLVVDVAFLGANLLKIPEGGWIPLVIAAFVLTLLTTWRRGRALLRRAAQEGSGGLPSVEDLLASIEQGSAARVRGTAVYLHSLARGVPRAFLHNLEHNKVVHQHVLFLTITTDEVPLVGEEERVRVRALTKEKDFWQVTAHYGFMEEPNVPDVLQRAAKQGVTYTPADTSYFLGRETVIPSTRPGMALWRERLFALMMRNAGGTTTPFGLTANRVVELGAEVEI